MGRESNFHVLTSIEVPDDYRTKWQGILDALSAVIDVPEALVMRAHESEIEVFSKSSNEGIVLSEGDKIELNTGLYCESVMSKRQSILVSDARKDPQWENSPGLKFGMVSYLGFPLLWPTKDVFGSICVLDRKEREYPEAHQRLLEEFRNAIHVDLASIYREHQLKQDIANRRVVEDALRTALKLNGLVDRMSVRELVQACLDEAERITGSRIGFLHFVNQDEKTIELVSWSTATQKICQVPDEPDRNYPVVEAGVWVDCIRDKKPVVHNNYGSLPNRKGLPDGHVEVIREAVVPIIDKARVVAIIGVGNKDSEYTDWDVHILSLLAKSTWVFIHRKRVEAELDKYRNHLEDLVTERTNELVKVSEERSRLATAIEQSAEIVVITGKGGTIQYVNPTFEKVTGYSREEAIGSNPRILKSGEHDEEFYKSLWKTIKSGKVWQGRLYNRKKDGSLFIEDATISPILDENGVITNYVAVKRDITREVELEEQFQQAQKMEAVGRLAGGVAHDFNNMMTIVTGYGELLRSKLEKDEAYIKDLDEIIKAGKRATDLTRQLLAFSRRQVLKPQVLNLNKVVSGMEKMLQRLIGEDIELAFTPGQAVGNVNADQGQIVQIVMNLAVNARDAMPKGGKLTIETTEVCIDKEYAETHIDVKPGYHVMLAMTDTGTGMDEETKSRIFEPFYTTKEAGKGTGLGLSTVYGIIKQSGGNIEVASEPGKGTKFIIYLPCIVSEEEKDRPSQEIRRPSQGGETILLVEDDKAVRSVIIAMLQGSGYTILDAGNGDDALQICENHKGGIDLLLSDVVLPGMSGRELADQIEEKQAGMKILLMSGYTNNAIQHHGVLDPGTAFIEKPFTPATLTRKIRDVLDWMDGE
jgi:PAS domain S-box-containing protein